MSIQGVHSGRGICGVFAVVSEGYLGVFVGICGYLRLARFDCDNPLRMENLCFPLAWPMDSAEREPRLPRQGRPENRDDQTSNIILLRKEIQLWGLKVGGGRGVKQGETRPEAPGACF